MKRLPSFITTYQRVFKLFIDTFIYVLPFVLLCVAFEFFITKLLITAQSSLPNRIFAMTLLLLIAGLVYCFVIRAVYDKYHHVESNYSLSLKEGFKRYPDFILSQLILVVPLIILFALASIPNFLASEAGSGNLFSKFWIAMCVCIALAYLLFCLYFYVSPVQIINEKHNAIAGLKRSLYLVKGYWIDTFLLIFSLALVVVFLEWIFRFALGDYATELARLLTFSLGACLVVVHCDHLEKAKDNAIISTSDEKTP